MATQGIINPFAVASEVVYPIDAFVRSTFFQEAPLFAGLPRLQIGADKFKMGAAKVRSKSLTLGVAITDAGATSITVSDGSIVQVGDVLELISGERVEVTADPAGNVLTVRRGVEGTTAATQLISTAVYLLYNSRTGAEVDQTGNRSAPTFIDQYVQTFQYPVQIGGKAEAMNAIALAGGASLSGTERDKKLIEFVRDAETALCYGKGDDGAVGSRRKMKGLKAIITEGASGNVATSPVNASAYTPVDLHRDAFQTVIAAGGRPDTLLVSAGMVSAFVKWGWAKILQSPSETGMGVNTQQMFVPLLGYPITLLVSMMLRGNTAVCLSTTDGMSNSRVRNRFIRQESWSPRANRGDAVEGEWLGDFAIEVDDPSHHSWVEGVTTFAAP